MKLQYKELIYLYRDIIVIADSALETETLITMIGQTQVSFCKPYSMIPPVLPLGR